MQEAKMTDNLSCVSASDEPPIPITIKVEPEENANNAPEMQTPECVHPMETGVSAPPVQVARSDATEKSADAAAVEVAVDIKPEIDLDIVRLVEDKPATEEISSETKADSTETHGSSAGLKESSTETEECSAEMRQGAVLEGIADSGNNGRKTSAKGSVDIAQCVTASSNGASDTIKEEVDENKASEEAAVENKENDVTEEGSLLRSRLQGVACQKSALGQKLAEKSNQACSTKNPDKTLKQSARAAAPLSLRDVLGPDVETGDLSSGSDNETEKQEVVSCNVPRTEAGSSCNVPRTEAGPSWQLLNASAQKSTAQNAKNVGQAGKTSADSPALYSCLACGLSFRFRSTLKFHLARDVKKLSYECKHCAQKMVFYNKCKLTEHVRNHGCDAIVPDMGALASVTIPKSYHSLCGDSSSEDDDSDSEIEVCDFDSQQLSALFEGTAYVDLNSGGIAVENESVPEKLEESTSGAFTDGGTLQKGTMLTGSGVDHAEIGSHNPIKTQPEDTVKCLVNVDSKSEPEVGSVNPAVINREAIVRSPTPVTSNSKCTVDISKSAGNESDSLIGNLNRESKRRPEDSTEKFEPAAKSAKLASATSSYIVSLAPATVQNTSFVRAMGTISTHALVKHISSIGPVPSDLRSAPSPVRPVLSVRPFHSVKPVHSYKWVSSIATQASLQKPDTAVGAPGCVVGKPVVTVRTTAVDSPAVTVGTSAVTGGTSTVIVGTPLITVGTPAVTSAVTVGTPTIGVSTSAGGVGTSAGGVGTSAGGVGTSAGGVGTPKVGVGTIAVVSTRAVGTPVATVGTPVTTVGTPVVTGASPVFSIGTPTVTVGNLTVTLDRPTVIAEKPPVSSSYVGLRVKGFALEQNSNNIQNLSASNKSRDIVVICSECQNKMAYGDLKHHFEAVTPAQTVESLLCTKCNLILPSSCSLKAHKRIHSKQMPFACPECGNVFTTFDLLTTHLQCVCFHMQKCVCYCCTYCKVLCKTAEDLTEHILRSKHFMYAFVCTACTTVHQKYADLQLHMEQHHGPVQQPSKRIFYECLLCPKKLICVAEIRMHAATHPKMREALVYYYKCGTCNVVAYTKDKFAAHRETCGLTVSVHNGGRPSHKLIVKQKGATNTNAPQTVLIQAVDSKGNITFQRHLVRGKFVNAPNATVMSPIKILKTPNPVSNTDVIHKNLDAVPNTNGPKNFISSINSDMSCNISSPLLNTNAIKNFSSLPNSRVINFVDANAECGNSLPVKVTLEKNGSKIQASSISVEENESEFTAVFDSTEENEKDPLSLEGMEPSKTMTSSCVVCGKFVERSLIRSEVQRMPVRCASCVAKSCYQPKPKNSSLLVVSPKSISSSNLQPCENNPARKKRRLSLSGINDKVKCRSCSCLMSRDYPIIQNHYKTVHNEELELIPDFLDQKVKAVKEHTSSSTEEENNKTDKKNGVDQVMRNGSYVKAKKKRKSLRTTESKSSTPSTQSVSGSDDVNDSADTEGDAKLDSVQKDLREGYPCNYGNCQFSTDDINVFREHIITHRSGEYIYQCMECGYASKSGFSLSYHLMIKHGILDVENYTNDKKECYFGNESESSDYDSDYSWSESRLDSNVDDVAENECRVCRETFDSSQELDQHIRTHGMAFLVHIRKNRNTVREKPAVQS